jgi:hypothetical protein
MSSTLKLRKSTAKSFVKTVALEALGEASFAAFPAIRVPGTVLWCNFDLARELGFDVPRTNQITPALCEQLLDKLSLSAATPGDDIAGQQTITLYADRYGGDGVTPALGAGRAGFLPEANLYFKGLGFTPLFRHNDKDDFVHSHGGLHLEDCLSEAIFAEVDHNLFELGASRIVAIIDQGKFVTEPTGRCRHIALAVRTGAQLRPGHVLARRVRGSATPLEMFVSITRATNQLVMQNGSRVPDLSTTMLRVIDDHARTAADSFRWRMIHGALSPSNMDMSGAMLDVCTQSSQPRTAPIFLLDYVQSTFGTEHKERGFHLADMYRRILRATDRGTREHFNLKWLNVSQKMDQAYEKHLQVKLMSAAGIKTAFAREIQVQCPETVIRFTNLLLELAALRNPGSACVARKVARDISVVDVFHLLGSLASQSKAQPIYKGNHFHVAAKKRRVEKLLDEFVRVYRELMDVATDHYPNRSEMERSISARAAFENQPIDALYCYPLYEDLNRAIADYKTTGNAQLIGDLIDQRISRSLRSVDALLVQGGSYVLNNGTIEVQRRTIRGITYSVRRDKLHVSIPVEVQGKQFVTAVPGLGNLTKRSIQTLRYRFTTDGGKTFGETRARLLYDEQLGALIDFADFDSTTPIGRIEGLFYTNGLQTPVFDQYVFALPNI